MVRVDPTTVFYSSDKGGDGCHGGLFFELGAQFVGQVEKALPLAFPEGQRVNK